MSAITVNCSVCGSPVSLSSLSFHYKVEHESKEYTNLTEFIKEKQKNNRAFARVILTGKYRRRNRLKEIIK
jgi:hypothetical protein